MPTSSTRSGRALRRGVAIPAMPAGPDGRAPARRAAPAGALPLLRRGRRRRPGRRRPHDPVRHPRPAARPVPARSWPWPPRSWTGPTAGRDEPLVRIAGVCGRTAQAVAEAELARDLGYHAGLLSLAALTDADEDALHRPLPGGRRGDPAGRLLPPAGRRRAGPALSRSGGGSPRSRTSSRSRSPRSTATRRSTSSAPSPRPGRDDIALYTGNDDNIVLDLLTPYRFERRPGRSSGGSSAGCSGHWSVWTRRAVELLDECHARPRRGRAVPAELLRPARRRSPTPTRPSSTRPTTSPGCIAGLHEVLRRQGLLEGIWCLDPDETLSPGQAEEIDRVYRAYPELNDDAFVAATATSGSLP